MRTINRLARVNRIGRLGASTGSAVVLPANTTVFLTAGPSYCFQGRGNVSVPCGNGDPVGTWVDRVDGTWFVAPSDAARPTLTQIGGKWAVQGDGADDKLVSNKSYGLGAGPLTVVLGVNNGNDATNRFLIAGNATNELGFSLTNTANRWAHARYGISTSTIVSGVPAGNNLLSGWSSGIVAGNISVTGRVNGGSNGTSTPIFSTSAGALTIGESFNGSFFSIVVSGDDLSSGTGLALAESLVQGQMP